MAMLVSRAGRSNPLRGCRILVVEDDGDIRRMVQVVLEAAGAHVESAANGAEAVRALEGAGDLNVVVLDWNLTDMPAVTLLAQLRNARPELGSRIVVMTGDLIRRDTAHPAEAGGLVLVRKPFRPNALVDTIARLLAGKDR